MADNKANILLTSSLVVITLSVRYLGDDVLRWAAATLIAACLLTIALAAYVAMPQLRLRPGKAPRTPDARFNLLFFGDFLRLGYEGFEEAMADTLRTPASTYRAQLKEIYLLGEFLEKKKFRYLRLAYFTLLLGLALASLLVLFGGVGGKWIGRLVGAE